MPGLPTRTGPTLPWPFLLSSRIFPASKRNLRQKRGETFIPIIVSFLTAVSNRQQSILWGRFPEVRFFFPPTDPSPESEVLVGYRHLPSPADFPALRWLHLLTPETPPGFEALAGKIPVLSLSRGLQLQATAEHAFALLLASNHYLPPFPSDPADGRKPPLPIGELRRRRLGILGAGPVSEGLARLARRHGLKVSLLRRSAAPHPLAERVFDWGQRREFFRSAEHFASALPYRQALEGCLDREGFRAMGPEAHLVHLAPLALVNQPDLLSSLREKELGGFAVNLWPDETLPAEHPLWTQPEVILAPHPAASPSYRELAWRLWQRNLERYLAGRELRRWPG